MKAPSTNAVAASDMRNGLSKAQASWVHQKGHSFEMQAPRPQAGRIETRNPEEPKQNCVSHGPQVTHVTAGSQIHQKLHAFMANSTKNCIVAHFVRDAIHIVQ